MRPCLSRTFTGELISRPDRANILVRIASILTREAKVLTRIVGIMNRANISTVKANVLTRKANIFARKANISTKKAYLPNFSPFGQKYRRQTFFVNSEERYIVSFG